MRALGVSLALAALLVFSGVALPTTADPDTDDLGDDERVLDAIEGLNGEPPANPGVGPRPSRYDAVREVAQTETVAEPNPWGEPTVTVGVQARDGEPNGVERLAVEETVAYWNDHSAAYSSYDVEFEFAPDEPRPDISVYYVSHIDDCGVSKGGAITLACAPRFDEGETASVPTTVRVRDSRPLGDLRFSVKHEFGHLLGLRHGEGPMPLMAERTAFEPGHPVIDATERGNPFHDPTISVAVTQDGTYEQAVLEAHVREALDYYETESVSPLEATARFRMIDDPERADIVLRVTRDEACSADGSYCWTVTGEQLDRDAPLEYYTGFEATFSDPEPRYLSWYIGRVMGFAMGAQDESELPNTFSDPYNAPDRWFDAEAGHRPDTDPDDGRSRIRAR